MVGEKYVCLCTLPKNIVPQRQWSWSEIVRIPVALSKKSLSIELHWNILQAVHCIGWNNWSSLKQILSRMDVLFLMSIFRLYLWSKLSFEYNSANKNLFLSACICWDSRFLNAKWTKILNLVEPFVMVSHTGSFYFVISKCLHCIQYYMMPLEQWEHMVAKRLVTVSWLDGDKGHVC